MKRIAKNIKRRLRHLWIKTGYLHISTKITLIYATAFFIILAMMSFITGIGVYISLYRSAGKAMHFSIRHVTEKIAADTVFPPQFSADDPVLPGVVLRITDLTGQIVYENDSHYPSISRVESSIINNPPFWADSNMFVAEMERASIYYAKIPVIKDGAAYELHFFRTITAEKQFFSMLQRILLATNLLGFLIALLAGYFLSSRILKPIRDMTAAAQRIEVERMDERIPTRPVRDELNELAKTFNHMLNRLQTGVLRQQRFVSDASHELRTPVTVILGYADMLSRWGKEDEEILAEGIDAIKNEAAGMQKLIEKLLFLARADQKRQTLKKEIFELAQVVSDVMKQTKLIAETTHTIEVIHLDEGLVYADKDSFKQMMRIFLENSVKYTPEGGNITAELRRKGKNMRLWLNDNGIGIAKEHQEKIFERFYRVDTSRTKEKGGTGLGLSIARWIADENNITIRVVSDVGEGTSIEFTLPVAAEDARSIIADKAES